MPRQPGIALFAAAVLLTCLALVSGALLAQGQGAGTASSAAPVAVPEAGAVPIAVTVALHEGYGDFLAARRPGGIGFTPAPEAASARLAGPPEIPAAGQWLLAALTLALLGLALGALRRLSFLPVTR